MKSYIHNNLNQKTKQKIIYVKYNSGLLTLESFR